MTVHNTLSKEQEELIKAAVHEQLGRWHLDKRVPLALLFVIVVQIATILWYGGRMAQRIENIERVQIQNAPNNARLTRIETQFENIADDIREIKDAVKDATRKP